MDFLLKRLSEPSTLTAIGSALPAGVAGYQFGGIGGLLGSLLPILAGIFTPEKGGA